MIIHRLFPKKTQITYRIELINNVQLLFVLIFNSWDFTYTLKNISTAVSQ